VPQKKSDAALSNTFNATEVSDEKRCCSELCVQLACGTPDLDCRIAIINPKNPNPISMKPWVEGSGADDVDVTLKEAIKTSPADALRPGTSTVGTAK
jgi:hypothetical protein